MPPILGNIIAITAVALLLALCVHTLRQGGGCTGSCDGCGDSCSLDPEKMKKRIERKMVWRKRRRRIFEAIMGSSR
ncbi:MAG: hypothetical protein PUB39_02610 [Eubacteriales bacterium]|nr:hypothetical protein [Eubacteriales bacterium]